MRAGCMPSEECQVRRSLATSIGALLLIMAAAWIAERFRALAPLVDLRAMTWDAARHTLIGLDIFDYLRRFELLPLALRLQDEHWWPPLFGLVSLPAWLIGGRRLSSPSLVSLASYCLLPAVAWLSIRRLTTDVPLLAWGLVALFFLRSPMLIEMSAWSMLEPVAALFAATAFFCFLTGPGSRARNWAYGLAGASTLLKYHYGFFLLVTLGIATVAELDRGDLAAAAGYGRLRLRHAWTWIPIMIIAVGFVARSIANPGPHSSIPSVPNLIWIAYISALIIVAVWGMRTKRSPWDGLPAPLVRFITFGLSWPLIWCLDPANVRAWYRELTPTQDPPARWIDQIRTIAQALVHEYSLGPAILAVVLVGVAISIVEGVRRRHVGLLALTLHTIWPAALMSLSTYPMESRFLNTLVVCSYMSAAAGWTLFVSRGGTALRIAASFALLGLLVTDQLLRTPEWERQLAVRRAYRYASGDAPHQFVLQTVNAFSTGPAVLLFVPHDLYVVAPTVRLGIRLAMRDVRPDAIDVEEGDTSLLAKRLRRFPGGLVGVETDPTILRRLMEQAGLKVVSLTRGPALPDHPDRALLISRVER
jgi:hypothetical protein